MDRVNFARYSGETAKIIFAPLFIGLARRYFEEADVEVVDLDLREQPWETVAAHRADCGAGNIDYCVNPRWAGRMKAAVVHEQFRPGHGLTSLLARRELVQSGELTADPSTLRGKTIALPPERGDDYLAYYGVLRQGGLTIDDVTITPTGHGGSEESEDVDVRIGRRPRGVAQQVASGQFARWKQGDEIHPNLQARYLLFSNPFMEERPEVGIRFLTAYLQGARDYCDAFDNGIGKQDMIDLLVRETGESAELLTTMKPLGFSPNGMVDFDRLRIEMDALLQANLVPAGTKQDDVLDHRFVEAAVERLGVYP
jgi:ABC-type nitrate/sulfonate/bicarbonate transport system substrate-binding protein